MRPGQALCPKETQHELERPAAPLLQDHGLDEQEASCDDRRPRRRRQHRRPWHLRDVHEHHVTEPHDLVRHRHGLARHDRSRDEPPQHRRLGPGDTIQRSVDLINSGSLDLASVTLTTTAAPSSLLDTDATNGLQMVIDKCSVAWTESGPPYTYTCSGSTSTVLASRAVIGSTLALSNLGSTTAGVTDHLRVTLTLPGAAGNTFQNQSSTISYAFTGTQRTATSK